MTLKALLPLILTSVLTIIAATSGTIEHLVGAHPLVTAGLVIAAKVLHAALPSIFTSAPPNS